MVIRIRISDPKGPITECLPRVDSSVTLMHPWSEWSWITDPDPDHSKGTHPTTTIVQHYANRNDIPAQWHGPLGSICRCLIHLNSIKFCFLNLTANSNKKGKAVPKCVSFCCILSALKTFLLYASFYLICKSMENLQTCRVFTPWTRPSIDSFGPEPWTRLPLLD